MFADILNPSPAKGRPCNLVMIANQNAGHHLDFPKVQEFIHESSPHVRTCIWQDGPYRYRRWQLLTRPTMVFSPVPLHHFSPLRGRVFAGKTLSKSQEYAALAASGVPIPQFRILSESNPKPADLEALGKYVVVKPDGGARGAHVKIMRASRAQWKPLESRIAGKSESLLAQEFIYTGAWPVSYRVTSLFGQALWALKVEANHTRAGLESADGFDSTPGLSVVSNSKGCVMSLCNDEEVIRFAESAHAAFPDIPLLGIDVLRRHEDGKLFVIEVNSSGWVWHFSSPLGLRAQAEFGFKFESQFDGLRKAARVLAAAAERFAV